VKEPTDEQLPWVGRGPGGRPTQGSPTVLRGHTPPVPLRSRRAWVYALVSTALVVSAGAGFLLTRRPAHARSHAGETEMNAREIRNAAQRWRGLHEDQACPTMEQLARDKELDPDPSTDDFWGNPFRITCIEDDVWVSSAGPDRTMGTADDIIVPRPAAR
jgi:hypothetical protein